jgi:transcriptional accessory protein Tex/SPT6
MSDRPRRRAGTFAPIVVDETPTPKQSNTWGVMHDICELSIKRLVEWATPRELHRDADMRAASAAAMAMAQQFSDLLVVVDGWKENSPHPKSKSDTTDEILRLREDAGRLLQRMGATL